MQANAANFDRVEIRQVSHSYGREPALTRLNFAIKAGETIGLLGPNGAGKSTLLGIFSTLIQPTTGQVLFAGEKPSRLVRASLGYVAHETMCYGDLSGRENLAFFARLYGMGNEAKDAINSLIKRLDLDAAAQRPVRSYSRGMRQRLAIARALIGAPRLLLLDEPFMGLDANGAHQLSELIAEQQQAGTMMVLASHDLAQLTEHARRLIVLRRGRLVHDGSMPGAVQDLAALYRTLLEEKSAPPSELRT